MTKRTGTFRAALMAACMLALVVAAGSTLGQPPAAEDLEPMQGFIGLMNQYLDLSNHWVESVAERETAIFLAVEGIVEVYENQGRKGDAIPHVESLLQRYRNDRAVRTILRFKLRDLYNETGQSKKALEQLDQIISENGE